MQNSVLFRLSVIVVFGWLIVVYLWDSDSKADNPEEYQFYNSNMEKNLTAFVVGGSGAVGMAIVRALAREKRFEKVTLIGRRKLELPESNELFNYLKFEQTFIPDFDQIFNPSIARHFRRFDVGFYTLGVSSSKVDSVTYRKIEYGYSTTIAQYAKEGGCQHFHWVSGDGAGPNSWFLFGKTKAQVEQELRRLHFARVSVYRPAGILSDDNAGGMSGSLGVSVLGFLDRWNMLSIPGDVLGNVIVSNTFRDAGKSYEVLTNSELVNMGRALSKQTNLN